MKKVLFTTNIPSPYRVEFFNLLAEKIDLTVWYFWEKGVDNLPWNFSQGEHKYKLKVFDEVKIGGTRVNPRLFRSLRSETFDVVIVGGYSLISEIMTIEYLKFTNKPFVLNSDGGFLNNKSFLLEGFKRHLISSATYWLSSGKNGTETLIHYGAHKDRIMNYHFSSVRCNDIVGQPFTTTEKEQLRKNLNLPENKKIIISVGQYIERKGIERILISADELKNREYLFVLIGQGPLRTDYLEFLKQKQLDNVIILDFMEKKRLYEYYKASDLFVFPTKFDIWGLVLNEAISFGLPIISSNRAGSAYDLVDKNGQIFADNGESLSEQISSILESKTYDKFCERSLEIAREYTIERMVEKHLELFEKMETKHDC